MKKPFERGVTVVEDATLTLEGEATLRIYADGLLGQLQKKYVEALLAKKEKGLALEKERYELSVAIELQEQLIDDYSGYQKRDEVALNALGSSLLNFFNRRYLEKEIQQFKEDIDEARVRKTTLGSRHELICDQLEMLKQHVNDCKFFLEEQQKLERQSQDIDALHGELLAVNLPPMVDETRVFVKTRFDLSIEQADFGLRLKALDEKIADQRKALDALDKDKTTNEQVIHDLESVKQQSGPKLHELIKKIDACNEQIAERNKQLKLIDLQYTFFELLKSTLVIILTLGFIETRLDQKIKKLAHEQDEIRKEQEVYVKERQVLKDAYDTAYIKLFQAIETRKTTNLKLSEGNLAIKDLLKDKETVLGQVHQVIHDKDEKIAALSASITACGSNKKLSKMDKVLFNQIKEFFKAPTPENQSTLIQIMTEQVDCFGQEQLDSLMMILASLYPEIEKSYHVCHDQYLLQLQCHEQVQHLGVDVKPYLELYALKESVTACMVFLESPTDAHVNVLVKAIEKEVSRSSDQGVLHELDKLSSSYPALGDVLLAARIKEASLEQKKLIILDECNKINTGCWPNLIRPEQMKIAHALLDYMVDPNEQDKAVLAQFMTQPLSHKKQPVLFELIQRATEIYPELMDLLSVHESRAAQPSSMWRKLPGLNLFKSSEEKPTQDEHSSPAPGDKRKG